MSSFLCVNRQRQVYGEIREISHFRDVRIHFSSARINHNYQTVKIPLARYLV
ncbi:hypothetical protein HMPREF3212_01507 [Citrobacter freundii]|nr:hypothetical protein HMPREF3212_01507 [Citrobacter freundii]